MAPPVCTIYNIQQEKKVHKIFLYIFSIRYTLESSTWSDPFLMNFYEKDVILVYLVSCWYLLTTCLFQYMCFQYENHFFPHNEKGRKISFAKNFSSNTILEIVRSTYYILPYYHTVEIA